ncbi:Xaa-Pro dipeptidyl-peptidase [Streptococcus sp. zg-86]|uniref:Xaa-Pro dipeptidyl-peptidase n=1 Tax=Streptococcus zhangguiae TaxID=2664091 RepID=A0A6I4RG66_9STRE|nr:MULTISPECIES: Xaa-Pro dipeptidyl-peptidase [unclassified Streptococcus]MTB63579.1 Xaa-Pro dipeptidyl-peptidase [Streptococcus sp. zg-86]MTB89772.1 Xaa-Pro dipeptidyl-peptidase [Streptococcus sp. zg-36]MWV55443.1 Xaa-Pro dipeptidyl-peptidase [Streptococcus sp. zg-70]QTH47636.1 Xaa-Pro dipeptidyl-peptidase [Streptococcus sp. zg-86]
MRFNQFSYIQTPQKDMLAELESLGFTLQSEASNKKNLEHFVRKVFFLTTNTDIALSNLIADWETDLLTFFQSESELDPQIFYQVAFQLLGFVPGVDYTDVTEFVSSTQFPITYGNLIENLYQLLATRTKSGNTLIDQLISDGLIPEDHSYHFFNGKSLATFATNQVIREVVYVETPVDTTKSRQTDIVKVSILRPAFSGKVPAVITNSPYHQGINDQASDKALHKMEGQLATKAPHTITVKPTDITTLPADERSLPTSTATEKVGHINSYSLNDYFLARGFASIHVSGVGTLGSTGMMTSGDYQQVYSFKAVIDWLNHRARAYTDHTRSQVVKADWANGKVATTGLSYLGTMSNALATTAVDGLEVIIAEAGISSWYDYYRENGLVTSPGGYPGEDLDSLTALTYSRSLHAGDFLRSKSQYQTAFEAEIQALDRTSGDYNQYWHDRNYLLHADKVQCEVVFTHGSQDWNVKPIHVWNMFHALPDHVSKHLFFHNGAHVYMNNWQSIDFRESMNALLTKKLLDQENHYQLPKVIWQDNSAEQSWVELDQFGGQKEELFPLGKGMNTISNQYPEEQFTKYGKAYPSFLQDLFDDKAQQITIDIPITEELQLNGRACLHLRVKSSVEKGLLSAQLIDFGAGKRLTPIPGVKARASLDNGRFYAAENLMELPFVESPYRVVSKGYLNLQNRTDLLTIEKVPADEWLDIEWELQPTIYKFSKGSTLRLVLYTTDFECTIRDNSDWQIAVDLEQSTLTLPHE